MNDRHKPALLGGVFIGVLSALPFVGGGNCCCCLWVVLGGLLVAYLQQQRQEAPIEASQVALGGLLAGVIGAVIGAVLGSIFAVVLQPLVGPVEQRLVQQFLDMLPNVPAELRDQVTHPPTTGSLLAGGFIGLFLTVPIYAVFATLGALLGSAMFKKKTPPAPPATPV
jgi:hypothetical protein